ncbi:hypothetical protein RFI_26547 [Reticulomyxa filosa]|uniref:Uncharacterized protein n=1 Tax=Reticulomyxa filosa TaxID=46433 RepID=X6MCR8_RETFI|nr:hypothetical protein RFI_26547 [Reticulomyxa filosa]|eukprot:ETO10830.1 hypothetical protein RFI_26547 [Reticulomyxa filosa]
MTSNAHKHENENNIVAIYIGNVVNTIPFDDTTNQCIDLSLSLFCSFSVGIIVRFVMLLYFHCHLSFRSFLLSTIEEAVDFNKLELIRIYLLDDIYIFNENYIHQTSQNINLMTLIQGWFVNSFFYINKILQWIMLLEKKKDNILFFFFKITKVKKIQIQKHCKKKK